MKFFDTHCHLNQPDIFCRLADLMNAALARNVSAWLIPSVTPKDLCEILTIIQQYPQCRAAVGVHPWAAGQVNYSCRDLVDLLEANRKDIVAIGETGLDKLKPDWEQQLTNFDTHLQAAEQTGLPLTMHCVRAVEPLLHAIKPYSGIRGVIHGFGGNIQQAEQCIKYGLSLGVGSLITYKKSAKIRDAISKVDLEYLVLETDAPSMPLSGDSSAFNSPERIVDVFAELCSIRKESEKELAERIWQNSIRLFGDWAADAE